MIRTKLLAVSACLLCLTIVSTNATITEQIVEADVDLKKGGSSLETREPLKEVGGKRAEDNIPVIEIRGEGKPMTAAQIRALEEETAGKPLDIKVNNSFRTIFRYDSAIFHHYSRLMTSSISYP